jgi:hypothetical protein
MINRLKTIGIAILVLLSLWGGCLGYNKFSDWNIQRWHDANISTIDLNKFDIIDDSGDVFTLAIKRLNGRKDDQFYYTNIVWFTKWENSNGTNTSEDFVVIDVINHKISTNKIEDNNKHADFELSKLKWENYKSYNSGKKLEKYLLKNVTR